MTISVWLTIGVIEKIDTHCCERCRKILEREQNGKTSN